MREIIKKIKTLKSIKADEAFKFDLRKRLIEESGVVTNINISRLQKQQDMSILRFINNVYKRKNMLIPMLLIAALLGGGAGATYASQSSLPGDVLYPVKIASEKVQTALVVDDVKEADLHLKFSSERLEEVEELAQKGEKSPELVKLAVDNYKTELAQVQTILNSAPTNSTQTTQIAQNVADAVSQNKIIIVRVSKEFDDDDDILNILEEAWEEAIEHNDVATIALLQNAINIASVNTTNTSNNQNTLTTNTTATNNNTNNSTSTNTGSTTTTDNQATTQTTNPTTTVVVVDPAMQVKVLNKISEANHKIAEAEKYIAKKEAQGLDMSDAKNQVATAKTYIADAQNLLSQNKYSEAFLKAKEAHNTAKVAKELAEHKYKEEKHDDDKDEDNEIIFIIPSAVDAASTANTSTITSTNNTSTTTNNAASGTTTTTPTSATTTPTTSTSTQVTTNHDDDDNDKDDDHDGEDEDGDNKDEDQKHDRD